MKQDGADMLLMGDSNLCKSLDMCIVLENWKPCSCQAEQHSGEELLQVVEGNH